MSAETAAIDADTHAAASGARLDGPRDDDLAARGVDDAKINSEVGLFLFSANANSVEAQAAAGLLLVSNLGWSAEEAKETRARLGALEEDWDTPGMEDYDHL